MGAILTVDNINVYYGSIHAIKGISFEVNAGEIVTLIGANGAGKSTTLNTISGLLRSRTAASSSSWARIWASCPLTRPCPRVWHWFRKDGASSYR